MTAYNLNCPPVDCVPCGTLPMGFVRLRYFYGKRLGVADLVDEQRYHTGKLRFHNQRLHGSGVVCGLAVDLITPDRPTIVRVHRGAAIDGCGREIIVGLDQCIDVDAWLAGKLVEDPAFLVKNPPDAQNRLALCAVIAYRDSAIAPEPAPRDPCSCGTGSCEPGRVREEFILDLIVKPSDAIVPALFPPRDQLIAAFAQAPGGAAIVDRIAALATAGCPAADPDGIVELACFLAQLADPPAPGTGRKRVTGITAIEPAETLLYETALLQELVMRLVAADVEGGALADGPQVTEVGLDSATAPTALVVKLSAPVVASTVPPAAFKLHGFTATGGWTTPAVTTTYDNDKQFTIKTPAGELAEGKQLRLVLQASSETPIVDASMRPLRPLRFSFHFAIGKDAAGKLVITAPPIVP